MAVASSGNEVPAATTVTPIAHSDRPSSPAMVAKARQAECVSCRRLMLHDWTTVTVVQNIIKKRMVQANELKQRRSHQLESVN